MKKAVLYMIFVMAAVSFLTETGCKKKDDGTVVTNPTPDSTFDVVEVHTSYGNMYFWLYDGTPKHKANFLQLANSGFYDSTTYHRIIPNFVIQGGDPNSKDLDSTNDGYGGPGYTIPAEINASKYKHKFGAIGMASAAAKGPSNGSQFYVVVNAAGYPSLDGNYTVFGEVIKGLDVATTIVSQPAKSTNNRPYKSIRMSMKVLKKTRKEIKDGYGFTF